MWHRKPSALWACGIGVIALAAFAVGVPSSGDSMELSEDRDFIESLPNPHSSCPKPMCECQVSGSAGVTAKCNALDFEGQRFEGVINHLEVTNAPEIIGGLFLANHTLSSLGLQYLTTVKITNSSIKALNVNAFSKLPDLIDVDLSDNRIMYLRPDVFQENTMLRRLLLAGNPLLAQVMQNDYLLNVPSLTELDLSRCDMSTLSNDTFSRMTHLEHLWLAGNNLITLPSGTLQALTLLEELDLSDNLFISISTSMFAGIADLTDLRLRNNSIVSLAGVSIPELDTLDVSQNFFEIINASTFAGFPDLTNLNVSGNAVQRVDADAFKKLHMLQFLDLSGNDIKGPLPREVFSENGNLETLNLSDNPRMGGLPKGGFTGTFSALYQLDLSFTGLRHLDENSFVGMDYVSVLYLQGNNLSELKPEVLHRLSKLTNLDLSDNHLSYLDPKTFLTNGFLRRLDLSGNPLATVSPLVFASTPSLRWLDLSRCRLTSLWVDGPGPATPAALARKVLLRKLQHLNVAENQIETLRVSELELTGAPGVLDISKNPLKCSKELHYLMDWLVKHSVEPRTERRLFGLQNDLMQDTHEIVEDSLGARWAAVYDAVCGPHAFDAELAKLKKNILASDTSSAPTVSKADLDDINFVLGNKNLISKSREEEDDGDSYSDDDEDDSEDDDDSDDEDDADDDEEDEEDYNTVLGPEPAYNGTDYLIFSHRTSPYLWPIITIGVTMITVMLVLANVVICVVRRRRARRHARYQSPMFRHLGSLPSQPKAFGGIPGSFIKTKKDGGFVYKKLYEETTTPNPPVYFPQARTFKFPLDPSDLQGSTADPSRV